MNNILVVGSMNMDLSIEIDRMPQLGETLVGSGFKTAPGGKGANQAVAAARLGGAVKLLGAVGKDTYGEQLVQNLEANGIVYAGAFLENTATGIAMITVCGGNNFILLERGANDGVTPKLLEEKKDLFAWADFVILQLEIPVESVLLAAKLAKANGARVLLNPAPYKALPAQIYSYIDYLVPNEHEAADLVGFAVETEADCTKAVRLLSEKGVGQVIITRGALGCAYGGDTVRFQPAMPADAIDTTAAGDSFIGALVFRLCAGASLAEAVEYATRVSAVTVSRRGAAESIPYASEIEK